MTRVLAVALACALLAPAAHAQPPGAVSPSASLTDVSGVWTMLVAGHQIGLELEQHDTKVEGVMLAMGQRILLIGTYEGRALTLKREKLEGETAPENAGGGPIVATMKDDGTLEGELSTNRGRERWTGERLVKR